MQPKGERSLKDASLSELESVNQLPAEVQQKVDELRKQGKEVRVISDPHEMVQFMTGQMDQMHSMLTLYRNAALHWRGMAIREAKRFWVSVACNLVLVGLLWFAV